MKVHTTNYQDIFIRLAEDCPAAAGEIPPERKKGETAAMIQFEMISKHPYRYTSDDVLFQVYAEKNDSTEEELPAARARSEERRVGKACVSTCRSWWSQSHSQNRHNTNTRQ